MSIPNKLRIDTVDYKIITNDEKLILNGIQCKGLIDYDSKIINLDNSVQDSQGVKQTLFHEIIHGIIRERNINLKGDEELIVDGIATGLCQLIRDNEELFKMEDDVE